MELSPIYLYGKASGHTDFDWLGGRAPGAEISLACERWFHCHVNCAGDGSTVAGVRDAAGAWWFLRVAAAGTDMGGRVVHGLVTGRVQDAGVDFNPAMGVLLAFVKNLPDRAAWDHQLCVLPIPKKEMPVEPARLPSLLAARLLDNDAVLFAESPASAAAVLDRLGPESLAWVAASSGGLFGKPLPPGGGVVLVDAAREALPPEAWLAGLLGEAEVDLAALMALAKNPERRRVLLETAAGISTEPGELSSAELEWLLAVPAGRPAALRAATPAQAGWMAAASSLMSRDEVRLVAARLDRESPEQSRGVASVLAKTGDLLTFVEIFGPHHPGWEEFLSPPARAHWDYLQAPDTLAEPAFDGRHEALRELAHADMLSKLPLRTLGRHQRWPFVGQAFVNRLVREGLPDEIAGWLVLGTPPAVRAPVRDAPALVPDPSWVAGLSAARLEALGELMVGSSDGALWWQATLALHPDFASLDLTDLHGPWRAARGWLAVAGRLRGQWTSEALLAALVRWRSAGGPLWDESLAFAMLRAAGFTAGAFRELVGGLDETAARTVLENLDWLASGGLIDPAEEISRLPFARLASVVATLPPRDSVRSLLDPESPGPMIPPNGPLSPLAQAALLRFLHEGTFWSRWHDGIPAAIVHWLETQTATEPEAQIVAGVRDALNRTQISEPRLLATVCDALPSAALLHWAVLAGTMEEANVFLAARGLRNRPELAAWLRERLLDQGLGAIQPLPAITEDELAALFPILDVRHLLGWLDAHPAAMDPASQFGRRISARLRAECHLSQIALSQQPLHRAIYFRQT